MNALIHALNGNPPKRTANLNRFEEEKSKYIHIIGKYAKLDQKLAGFHPRFGALSHKEWGIFVWRHADHHLRQFGL